VVLTIAELIERYWNHAQFNYRSELEGYKVHWLDLHQIIDVIETSVSVTKTEGNGD
jgi:hypothetical protein